MSNYLKYRGRCKEMSEALVAKDPSLTLVRGYYHCLVWGRQPHWWAKNHKGEVVDPTKLQFPSSGRGFYEEFNGCVECENCGKEIKEEEAETFGSRFALCSYKCYGQLVGVV